jgi:hypothetical protein
LAVKLGQRAMKLEVWNHVACTLRPGEAALYVNGVLDSTHKLHFPIDMGLEPLGIGGSPAGADANIAFKGRMAYLAVVTRALSADEIASAFHTPSFSIRNLFAYYVPAGASGTRIPDFGPLRLDLVAPPKRRISYEQGLAPTESPRSIQFASGSSGLVALGEIDSRLSSLTEVSMTAWVLYEGPFDCVIFSKTRSGLNGFGLVACRDGLRFIGSARAGVDMFTSVACLPVGEWVHVACTFERGPDGLRLYINGTQSGTMTPRRPLVPGDVPLTIGGPAVDDDTGRPFCGSLAMLTVWDKALSPTAVQQTMDYLPAPGAHGLVACWSCASFRTVGTDNLVLDSSGNFAHLRPMHSGATIRPDTRGPVAPLPPWGPYTRHLYDVEFQMVAAALTRGAERGRQEPFAILPSDLWEEILRLATTLP